MAERSQKRKRNDKEEEKEVKIYIFKINKINLSVTRFFLFLSW